MHPRHIQNWERVRRKGAVRLLTEWGSVYGGLHFLAPYALAALQGNVQFRPGEALDSFVGSIVFGAVIAAAIWFISEWRYKRSTTQALK
jgi:hypothetical protein